MGLVMVVKMGFVAHGDDGTTRLDFARVGWHKCGGGIGNLLQ